MSQITAADVQKLTLIYFGRPADPKSLTAWPTTGLHVEEVVLLLTAHDEYIREAANIPQSRSNSASAADIDRKINLYYTRLFSRDAALIELVDWANAIGRKAVNFDYLGITIANAGFNLPSSGEAGIMKSVLLAKFEAAQNYTALIADDPAKTAAYTTMEAADKGRDFLRGLTPNERASHQHISTATSLLLSPAGKAIPAQTQQASSGPPAFVLTNGGAGTVWTLPASNGSVVLTSVGSNYQFTPLSGQPISIAKVDVTELVVPMISLSGVASDLKSIARITGAVTVSDTGSVAAADLNTITAASSNLVTATAVTRLVGTTAAVTTALITNKGTSGNKLNTSDSISVELVDPANAALNATLLSAIGAATTGTITVSHSVVISGTAAQLTAALVAADTLVIAANSVVNINDAANTALTATALSAIGGKTTGTVTVNNAVLISGTAAQLTAALVTTDTLVVAANAVVSINDAANTALTATALSAIGGKTTGTVTVNNAVLISGTAAELTAALVTAETLVVAANAVVNINDAANTALTATALSTIGGKTTGTVTVNNAVLISGSAAELTAALVTADTLVVAPNAGITITGNSSVSDANAIAAKTAGVVTATLAAGNLASFANLAETGNSYTVTVNDGAGAFLNASALSALGSKTTGTVTVSNAVMISGTADEVIAALVTEESRVVASSANIVVNGTISDTNLNAIRARTTGAITLVAQTIQGTDAAEVLNGNAGNDLINGGSGNDTITGGAGADVMTGGPGANVFILRVGDGIARSSENLTNSVVDGRTITFANGVDIITDFVSGKDKLDTIVPAGHGNYIGIGHDATTPLGKNWTLKIRGDYNQNTKVFTVNQFIGGADTTIGTDTLILANSAAAPTNSVNQTGWIVLLGVTTMQTADFISTANVTVPGTITVTEANTIAANTPGVVTATLATGNLASFANLAETDNAYTITIDDAANTPLNATDLSTLGGKTTSPVTVTNAVTISGSAAEVTAALVTADTLVVAATANVNITGTILRSARDAIAAKTTGVVTATLQAETIQGTANRDEYGWYTNFNADRNFILLGGDDVIRYDPRNQNINCIDTIDGGTGTDEILITGGAISFANDNNLRNVERFIVSMGRLDLTGQTEGFTLQGGFEDWQQVTIVGGSGNDQFSNIWYNTWLMSGAGGDDSFFFGRAWWNDPNDGNYHNSPNGGVTRATIDGGIGTDTITFDGSTLMKFEADANIVGVERIQLGVNGRIEFSNQSESFLITGSTGAEFVTAGSGDDTISGGDGSDVLSGRAGNDQIAGGIGADQFIMQTSNALNGVDTLTDFSIAQGDTIRFDFGQGANLANLAALRGNGAFYQRLAAGGAINANSGLLISTTNINDSTAAKTYAEGLAGASAGDIVYLIGSTNAGGSGNATLYRIDYTSANAAAVTTLAELGNIDISAITQTNINQFSIAPTQNAFQERVIAPGNRVLLSGYWPNNQGQFGTIQGYDEITNFGVTDGTKEILQLPGNAYIAPAVTNFDGLDSALTYRGWNDAGNAFWTHSISASGKFTSNHEPMMDNHVAAIIDYLSHNDIGDAGATVFFTVDYSQRQPNARGSNFHTWIYTQTGNERGRVPVVTGNPASENVYQSGFTVVDLIGVTLQGLETLPSGNAMFGVIA